MTRKEARENFLIRFSIGIGIPVGALILWAGLGWWWVAGFVLINSLISFTLFLVEHSRYLKNKREYVE